MIAYEGTVEMHILGTGQAMTGHAAFRRWRRSDSQGGTAMTRIEWVEVIGGGQAGAIIADVEFVHTR